MKTRRSGFTLIEVMISMSLLVILIGLSMLALKQVSNLSSRISEANGVEQNFARKIFLVRDSFEAAFDYYHRNDEAERELFFKAEKESIAWVTMNPVFKEDSLALSAVYELLIDGEKVIEYREWSGQKLVNNKPLDILNSQPDHKFVLFTDYLDVSFSVLAVDKLRTVVVGSDVRIVPDYKWKADSDSKETKFMPLKVRIFVRKSAENTEQYLFNIRVADLYKKSFLS